MAEYIERKMAVDAIADTMAKGFVEDRFIIPQELQELQDELEMTPAADVAPVVHGRWKERPAIRKIKNTNIPVVECSECGLTFCDIINNHTEIYRYCPYCGAKMDQE